MAEEKTTQWLSIGPAAKYVGVSRDTLRRWEKKGRLKAIRSPTNRRYYTKKQLDRLMRGEFEEAPEENKKEKEIKEVKEEKEKPIKSEKTPEKPKKTRKKTISETQKLIFIGIISFLVAFGLVFLIGSFF